MSKMNNPILTTRSRRLAFSMVLTIGLVAGSAKAGEINTGYFGDVAIKGYDPVAYYTMKKAVKGSEQFTHDWLGATWQFSSAEHQQIFRASPVKYAPQYGGYCADGVAYGQATANIDPEAWRIIDNKLYLNYDPGAAQELEELDGQLQKAEANWPEIKKKMTAQ
jgi:YHS domain-containing protein